MTKNILAICGSTRSKSSNLNLIHRFQAMTQGELTLTVYLHLSDLPLFNPDLDRDPVPEMVRQLRQSLREAEGVLICTPEYAMGLPGSLKNLLDWTVSSADFSKKPVAVITAASLGEKAHASLLGTLQVIEADVQENCQLLIPFIQAKFNTAGEFTDAGCEQEVRALSKAFIQQLQKI